MTTVAPTRRSRPSADPALEELLAPVLEAFEVLRPGEDDTIIVEAARAAELAHRGQVRRSGEDYVTHPVAVALTVAELGLDAPTVAAALLHDAVEDTGMSLAHVRAQFGEVVARVVDGVTKLDRLEFDSKEAQQAATIRKMFLAMATDWRVLLIKLADRLHNMRTIAVMPEVNQRTTAQETLDVYAPLAHRLGVQQVKWQLEDLAFATLQPKRYAEIEQMVASRTPEREQYVAEVSSALRHKLEQHEIVAELMGRPKHLWSIYEKMVVNGKEFDEIFDLVGLRAVVATEHDCWAVLGALHSLWHPVQGRFKDYINQPKFNLYQSLHTTVIGPHGKPIEVQIRTNEMHRRAEYGIAAHWGYKEHSTPSELAWMRRLTDTEEDTPDAMAFLEALKLDLEQDEVYVFTPKGRVLALVANSTPVDFAYAVHTEVGHHCIGAKVNGRLVPLDTRLSSADVVEILTSKAQTAGPSRDWSNFVQSARARAKIRQWFSRERREDSIEAGREELVRALRRASLPIQTSLSSGALVAVGVQLNLVDFDSLLAAIGESQISAQSVVQRLQRELRGGEEESLPTTVARGPRIGTGTRHSAGVYVEGLDDVMVHLAKCCSPVPGDQIMGFVTQGRGISVHRTDCSNATALANESSHRLVEVEWDASSTTAFRVTIDVRAFDRAGLLADVSHVVAEHHLNIVSLHSVTSPDRVVKMTFEVELADPSHLASVLNQLKHVDGVYDAYRQLPGRGR
jgi:guanosine-3',5'-bis(diphosphate) 3'-pyrophosphohydrolase